MPKPNFVLLYAENPPASEAFYSRLLGLTAVESHPTFVMFVLESGLKIGIWLKTDVAPPATPAGGSELCIAVPDSKTVDSLYADWKAFDVQIAQSPITLDFGYTFVALDPDGHRLRVFAPGGE